jgi:hypothetical protein
MRHWAYAVVLAVLAAGMVSLRGAGQDARPEEKPKADEKARADEKTRALMRRKLEHSQKILEALVLNDLDAAGKHSEELLKIRKDPVFRTMKTPEYELWSEEFTRSAEGIVKASRDGNLEAAKLQYLGMTMSCFHCHSYTRDMKKQME